MKKPRTHIELVWKSSLNRRYRAIGKYGKKKYIFNIPVIKEDFFEYLFAFSGYLVLCFLFFSYQKVQLFPFSWFNFLFHKDSIKRI